MSAPHTLLVVDDSPENIDLLTHILRPFYRVKAALSGERAIKIISSDNPPDLILLDIMMPDIDGYAVCRWIKAHSGRKNIPVIFVTTMEGQREEEYGLSLGAADFVTKPLVPSIVLARIKTHLALYDQSRHLEQLVNERTQALQISEERFRVLIEQAPEAIVVFDADRKLIIEANRRAEELSGYSHQQLCALALTALYAPVQPDGLPISDSGEMHINSALAGNDTVYQRIIQCADGTSRHCEVRLVVLPSRTHQLLRASFIDLSYRISTQEKIHRLAYFDNLTGLHNQTFLQERQVELISSSAKRPFAFILLDLDDFKYINDSFGHKFGDRLLQTIGGRLDERVKAHGFVVRRGGDEFVALITSDASRQHALDIAASLLECIQVPVEIDGLRIKLSASIGISVYPDDGNDEHDVNKNGEMAMYSAKEGGKSAIRFFEPSLAQKWIERTTLEHDLHLAIEESQFILHYQPQIDSLTGRMIGVEALLRWMHPVKGLIPPALFIPVAESSELIIQMGQWVVKEACRQMKMWQRDGLVDVTVAVNLSVAQFRDPGLGKFIEDVLQDTGLNAGSLELEITESCAMLSPEKSIALTQHLRSLGTRISIDDFGTGYSSLAYLTRLPIDTLKIDQSFVRKIGLDQRDSLLCETIANMAHRMKFVVVAEGVESQDQFEYLRSIKVDVMQGYLFSKPLPATEVMRFVQARTA